ncbi:MAG: hypothetical protein HPY75_05710 [Actinobacteria bacterium]|nr:hypothetical protein [Actinomycetota bacterium]
MKNGKARVFIGIIALMAALALLAAAAGPALAQEGQEDTAQREVPPELREKLEELREAVRELRGTLSPLMESIRDYVRDNRATLKGQQESWREGFAKRREMARGLREQMAPLKLVMETTKAAREAIRMDLEAARDAWEAGDTQGAIEHIDQALTKIEELNRVMAESLGSG